MLLIKCLILFAVIVNISNADGNDLDVIFNEGNPWESKLSQDLTSLKSESIRKLNIIEQKIPEHLDELINHKINALERNLPTKLEEYFENKFNMLEKKHQQMEINILEKLESYVDTKFSTLEKHITRKVDTLEQSIPDKADIAIVNKKLDAIKKLQLDSSGYNSSQSKDPNEITRKIELILNQKLTHVENSLTDITNNCLKPGSFDDNLKKLDDNLKNVAPDLQIIKQKLDTLNTNAPELNENNLNIKLDELKTQIVSLNQNINNEHGSMDNFRQNIDTKVLEMTNKIPELGKSLNKKMDALQTIEETVLDEVYRTECKELNIQRNYYFNPFFNIYDKHLKHVILRNDTNTNIEYFEIHFAIMSDSELTPYIILSPNVTAKPETDFAIEIGFPPGKVLLHKLRKVQASKNISSNLSSRQFTGFYIKIDNGKLEFGTENTPLLTHSDPLLKTIKYFSFSSSKVGIARFLYDCPTNSFTSLA